MGWLKRRLPKKRWKRVALYAISTLLIVAAADMGLVQYWRRIQISPETTRVVAPLNEAGTPDYITALNEKYGRGVTEENNAAGLLLKARVRTLPGEPAAARYYPLEPVIVGFPLWLHETANKVPSDEEVNEASQQFAAMRRSPWKTAEHPVWARWLDSQAKGLADARRAAERPKLFVPLAPRQIRPGGAVEVMDNAWLITHALRFIGWELVTDGMRRAGDGNTAGFREDIMAAMKLARLVGNGQTVMHVASGYSIEEVAVRAVRASATTPGMLSAEECRKLLAEMESVGPLPGLEDVVGGQMRWEVLDTLCGVAHDGLAAYDASRRVDQCRSILGFAVPAWSVSLAFMLAPVHYNAQLRQANAVVDEHVAALRLPTYSARQAAYQAILARHNWDVNVLTESGHLYYIPLGEIVGRSGIVFLEQRAHTEGDLARVALALAAYRSEHGAYPEKLDGLKEAGILREVPRDGFSDAPLVYQRRGGGYVLYTVGDKTYVENGEGEEQKKGYPWRVVRVE